MINERREKGAHRSVGKQVRGDVKTEENKAEKGRGEHDRELMLEFCQRKINWKMINRFSQSVNNWRANQPRERKVKEHKTCEMGTWAWSPTEVVKSVSVFLFLMKIGMMSRNEPFQNNTTLGKGERN